VGIVAQVNYSRTFALVGKKNQNKGKLKLQG
jgi:hypothetical protein